MSYVPLWHQRWLTERREGRHWEAGGARPGSYAKLATAEENERLQRAQHGMVEFLQCNVLFWVQN